VRSKSQGADEDYQWGLDRFIEEAQALAAFDHANIVRVYRYFRQNNTGYMVLKLEEGTSFKVWLDKLGRRPSQGELDGIVAPLLNALELIHAGSFLHRDIAPDNIMIRTDGSPVLIDFGSARRDLASHMRTMSVLVKPGYSPVEQYAQDAKRQGPWSDIYALAATLYHAVTGKRPPDAPARMQTDDMVPATTAAISGVYRPGFLQAIDTALALAIDKRPQSIAQWRPMLLDEPAQKRKPAADVKPAAKPRQGPAGTRKLDDAPAPIRLKPRKVEPPPAPRPASPPPNASPSPQSATVMTAQASPAFKPISVAELLAPAATMAGAAFVQARQSANGVKRWLQEAMPRRVPDPQPRLKPARLLERLDQAKPLPDSPPELKAGAPTLPAPIAPPRKSAVPKPPRPIRDPGPPLLPILRRTLTRLFLIIGFVFGLSTIDRWGPSFGLIVPTHSPTAATDVSLIRTLRGQAVPVAAITVTADGGLIASAGDDGQILVWDATTGGQLRAFGSPGTGITALSSSEHVLLAGRADGSVTLWQMDTGEKLAEVKEHEGPVWGAAFLGSSKQFATVGQDDKVRLWDNARLRSVWSEHKKAVFAIAYNPHAHLIATASADKTVKLWDEKRRRLIRSYDASDEDVRAVAISPDGSLLASAGNDKTISLWSTAADGKLRTLTGHTNRVVSVAFSPDGRLLASGSEDGTVRLWDVNSGDLLNTYEGHVQAVRSVAFSPDGHRLASAGDDMTVRLWNVRLAGYP
jgi:serine/threonine protein kinase